MAHFSALPVSSMLNNSKSPRSPHENGHQHTTAEDESMMLNETATLISDTWMVHTVAKGVKPATTHTYVALASTCDTCFSYEMKTCWIKLAYLPSRSLMTSWCLMWYDWTTGLIQLYSMSTAKPLVVCFSDNYVITQFKCILSTQIHSMTRTMMERMHYIYQSQENGRQHNTGHIPHPLQSPPVELKFADVLLDK